MLLRFTSILFLVLLISCRDHLKIEANDDPQGYADSQFVGNWKITAVSSDVAWDWNGDGTTEFNIYNTWTDCQKDNLYTFVGDKTGTYKLNCADTKDGSWQIINTSYLVYTPAGQIPESEKVVLMTSVQFRTSLDITLANGQQATITKIWSRQ